MGDNQAEKQQKIFFEDLMIVARVIAALQFVNEEKQSETIYEIEEELEQLMGKLKEIASQ